jgi:hypothetical protein
LRRETGEKFSETGIVTKNVLAALSRLNARSHTAKLGLL